MSVLFTSARVLTMGGPGAKRGGALGDLGILARASVRVDGDRISEVSAGTLSPRPGERVIDAAGRVLMPGFVDCHTHACFAGDRLDEWKMKLDGAAYLDILQAGGGIMSTVRAVRKATQAELESLLAERLATFLANGTTTVEIKSGYGLSTADELKMLRAIAAAASRWPGTVRATALLGHAIDPDVPGFVERTINETLPVIHAEFPGIAVDAFCERGAWSLADTVRLFGAARGLGHPIRVHADQFTSMGMVREAVRLGATSVDHLEATTAEDAAVLAKSETFAVGLPCTGLHLAKPSGGDFAHLRRLVDLGAKVAIATNFNPGSSPTLSMPLAIAAAVRFCGLTPTEAITACTTNAAALLGLTDRGFIAPGARADLVLLRHRDERLLAYEMGGNPVDMVVAQGRVVG
jgi:imidazolonepropionase